MYIYFDEEEEAAEICAFEAAELEVGRLRLVRSGFIGWKSKLNAKRS